MRTDYPRAASWSGDVLVPPLGLQSPRVESHARERVLHVALRDQREKQPGLERALRHIAGVYAEVDWYTIERHMGAAAIIPALIGVAKMVKPTLMFMQLQRATSITPEVIADLRRFLPAESVIVNWDGDQHHEPTDAARKWFVDLGAVCDTSLVVNTKHPAEYAALGVRAPGYLQIGIDEKIYSVTPDRLPGHEARVVFLASSYDHEPAYAWRRDIVDQLDWHLGMRFAVYGGGWRGSRVAKPMLAQVDEAKVYCGSELALSSSIRADLPRYTSDRLLRALACCADVLVERFPDMEGLGLEPGVNCRAWSTIDELIGLTEEVQRPIYFPSKEATARRRAAGDLVIECHTWEKRMFELLSIVDEVRRRR